MPPTRHPFDEALEPSGDAATLYEDSDTLSDEPESKFPFEDPYEDDAADDRN